MAQLDNDFQALTGLRYNVSQLVEGASTAEEKQKVYDFISWNIKKGRIMEKANYKALETSILNSIKNLNQNSTVDDVEETYTAEEAAAYNLTLDGALQYGAIKTEAVEAVEAVEAQDAVLYENAEEYNAAKGTELTDEEFEALDEEAKIKTPAVEAVEAVEAQDAVLYTNEEVDAYNAILPGAKKAGDVKE